MRDAPYLTLYASGVKDWSRSFWSAVLQHRFQSDLNADFHVGQRSMQVNTCTAPGSHKASHSNARFLLRPFSGARRYNRNILRICKTTCTGNCPLLQRAEIRFNNVAEDLGCEPGQVAGLELKAGFACCSPGAKLRRAAMHMKKYLHALNIGIQNNLAYRFNFFARALFGFIPLIALLSVWRTIYAAKEPGATVGPYTLGEMISYYLLATIVNALTAVHDDDWQIANDIRDGAISQFVVKPIDYLWYRLVLFASGRIAYFAVAAVPLMALVFLLRHYFVLPPDLATFGLFVVSLVLTALLQFFISYIVAMLAFWVLEVSTFIFIVYAFEFIASGHMFPLDILPPGLARALAFTPFPYELFFPISIYMGKTTGAELVQGLSIQAFWVVVGYACARFAWNRGLRRYAAVGG